MKASSSKRNKLFQLSIAIMMIAALLFQPSVIVKAQDVEPPAAEETSSESAPAEGTEESTPETEEVQTEEGAPADGAVTEEPAVVEDGGDPAGTNPDGEGTPVAENLTEVISVMEEAATILIDAEGEVLPLASEEAAEALSTAKDPWFTDDHGLVVAYTFIGGSCYDGITVDQCYQVENPIQAAVNDPRSTGKIVNILAGNYDVDLEVADGKTVILQGVKNGSLLDAIIRKITLNEDISGWQNVFSNNVYVNSGAHIQDGIDIVQAGGTVFVSEGDYEEVAKDRTVDGGSAKYQFGLYVGTDKNGITVQGIKPDGTPVTNWSESGVNITTDATNNFGASGVFIEGDHVTLNGLRFGNNLSGNNKTIEVLGDAFTLKNSLIFTNGGGSVYLNDWKFDKTTNESYLKSYNIDGNKFQYGASIDISSGAGYSGDVSGRTITNNTFDGTQADGSKATWALVSFNGIVEDVGWFVDPVAGAIIKDNNFDNGKIYIRSRGTVDENSFNWESYFKENSYDLSVVTLENGTDFVVKSYSYNNGSYDFENVRRIGSVIQDDITDVVQSGESNKVLVGPGFYYENLIIDKSLEIAGAGANYTTVRPAISKPKCAAGVTGSLCPGASNIILVQANDVTVHDMTLDGNNPLINSGILSNDVDVDARNGIITNSAAGVFNNLEVFSTIVKNIYLRGIYASSGGTFNFHNNTVENVDGENQSIAMMNFGGSGIFSENIVRNSNDGIVSNWSTGTKYLNNTVYNVGTGIHSDNYSPSTANLEKGINGEVFEIIQGNSISGNPNGYGIMVYMPYGKVFVDNNTIWGVAVGLTSAGSSLNALGGRGSTLFSNNQVSSGGAPGSVGAYLTTDSWGYGYAPVAADFNENVFEGNDYGFYFEDQKSSYNGDKAFTPQGVTSFAQYNAIVGARENNVFNMTGSTPVMNDNWWDDNDGPKKIIGNIIAETYLKFGLNASLMAISTYGSSTLTPYLYTNVDPSPLDNDIQWFDAGNIEISNENSLGSMDWQDFIAGGAAGRATFASELFGKGFGGLAFVDILANEVPPAGGDDGGQTVFVQPPAFVGGAAQAPAGAGGVIPVTGGMNQLSCEQANTLMLGNGNSVAFSAPLCGFEAGLNEEAASSLPAPLPGGLTFVSGMTLGVQNAGVSFNLLPEPVTSTLSFAMPEGLQNKTFVILFWDAKANGGLGAWVEVPSTGAGTAVTDAAGTFILAYK